MTKWDLEGEQEWNDGQQAPQHYTLRLFITGASTNSIRAVNNLKEICETYIKDRYTLEIIDVHQERSIAEKEELIALPLLKKLTPYPERRLIGDMSDTAKVLKGLGIPEI
ncbi:circadian clock KaiB family protein [Dyadobacter luticola]|uniref:Circadian clock protein KaiB n=1 Tax=Dyadobacter luticola TaxID=1979387 RepID=A0A5R9L1F5_9BACT|nr:circadian clock KaiB family protein [Dyadobacter luticola]TLV02189.1 circadian clock protein KaiB [Dyadobacter luticola]